MVNFYAAFIDETYRQTWVEQKLALRVASRRLRPSTRAAASPVPYHISGQLDREFAAQLPRPPFTSLIAHFDHIIRVAGIDHVGIGTDFDGISALPEGIDSAADLPKITTALLDLGYSAEGIHKVLGGNLMRVFGDIQAAGSV